MTDENVAPPSQLQHRSAVVRTLGTLPSWKRKLLGVSLVVGLVGVGGEAATTLLKRTAQPPPSTVAPASDGSTAAPRSMPSGSSGFVSGQPSAAPTGTAAPSDSTAQATDKQTLTEKITPWLRRVGLSFFIGIVIGVVFRTFIKVTAGLVVVIGGIILALSYFHVLNIDMSSVQTQYSSATAWLGDQVSRLKDAVLHSLPSSSSAAAGFLSGFKKK
jgi:uncharacterized membrane protein (Fun14 family)